MVTYTHRYVPSTILCPSINTVLWGTCHCSQPLTKDEETEEREDFRFEHRQTGSRASAVLPPEGQTDTLRIAGKAKTFTRIRAL